MWKCKVCDSNRFRSFASVTGCMAVVLDTDNGVDEWEYLDEGDFELEDPHQCAQCDGDIEWVDE